jgi:hypothetical protein
MKKVTGYILSILGLAGIVLSFDKVLEILKLKLPEILNSQRLGVIGIILVIIGILLILGSNKKTSKQAEVPIYKGDKIVGYRRN